MDRQRELSAFDEVKLSNLYTILLQHRLGEEIDDVGDGSIEIVEQADLHWRLQLPEMPTNEVALSTLRFLCV